MFKTVKSLVSPVVKTASSKGYLSAVAQPKPNPNPEIQFTGVRISINKHIIRIEFHIIQLTHMAWLKAFKSFHK